MLLGEESNRCQLGSGTLALLQADLAAACRQEELVMCRHNNCELRMVTCKQAGCKTDLVTGIRESATCSLPPTAAPAGSVPAAPPGLPSPTDLALVGRQPASFPLGPGHSQRSRLWLDSCALVAVAAAETPAPAERTLKRLLNCSVHDLLA